MPSQTKTLGNRFVSRLSELEGTRAKMEDLLFNGLITVTDTEQVYAGLFLDAFTEFEALLEKLFLGLLMGELYSPTYTVKKTAQIKPVSMTRGVVFGKRAYLDWLPYTDHTIPRAKRFFDNGEPFTLLSDQQKRKLRDYHLIRNAIAHKSESADKKFQDLISAIPLLPQERTPSGYLRSKPYGPLGQTQYEIAILELENTSTTLCA